MAYRGTEAYDFSLFEPQVVQQPARTSSAKVNTKKSRANKNSRKKSVSGNKAVAPKRATANRNTAPARKSAPATRTQPKRSNVVSIAGNYQQTVQRNAKSAVIPGSVKKAMAFVCFCFGLLVILLVVQTQCDTIMSEISTVQSEINIAKGENVRLNAELCALVNSDKIENYAENKLGMVKAESYQISYIDLSQGDEIVVSGDKTAGQGSGFGEELKKLFAYSE